MEKKVQYTRGIGVSGAIGLILYCASSFSSCATSSFTEYSRYAAWSFVYRLYPLRYLFIIGLLSHPKVNLKYIRAFFRALKSLPCNCVLVIWRALKSFNINACRVNSNIFHSKFEIVIFRLIDLVIFVWLFDIAIFKFSVKLSKLT